jgi:glycosyltransferase involved in cell wall biosynthesis
LYNFKILDKCDQIINKIEPDIVHTNNLYHISLGIWRIIKKKKICVIHTVRDQYLTQSHSKIKNWLFKLMTRYVDYLTSPSNFTLQHFLDRNYFPKVKKSVRIFNSNFIDYDYFNRCRKKKLHREGSLNFAYLGRYSPEKGVLFLLDTFKRYNENNNNRLILFGKGILEERINQVIELWPNIVNKGYLEEKDLYYNLEEIDVLIVPSICDEVFGRVVIDAYQCAIPVIASRKGGLPEIVHDRHTGELFSANNSDELIKLMKKFEDRSLLNKYIDNIPTYLKDYDIQKQEHEFLELYKKACQMQSL